jgi:hypothetical protein
VTLVSMREWESTKIRPSRALCGTTPDEFGDLLVRLAPLVEPARALRLARDDRVRAPGAGMKPRPFRFRLLVALTHLRQGTSLRATGGMFDVDEKSVRNWRDELETLAVAHGVRVAGRDRPVRTLADLAEYLVGRGDDDYVIIDGTDIPRPRPGTWEAQRPAWSGKSHDHVVKATVVADPDGNPIWFEANPSGEGRTQDITMLRSGSLITVLGLSAITILADLGYQGLGGEVAGDVYTPNRRRPRKKHLDRDERLYNHGLAQSRIRVEHSIARLKRWGALRQHRRRPDTLDRVGRATVVLDSLTW